MATVYAEIGKTEYSGKHPPGTNDEDRHSKQYCRPEKILQHKGVTVCKVIDGEKQTWLYAFLKQQSPHYIIWSTRVEASLSHDAWQYLNSDVNLKNKLSRSLESTQHSEDVV